MATLKALDPEANLREAATGPICVLLGDDDGLKSRALGVLTDAAAPPDQPGSTLRVFESVPEARDVFDELRTIPFMGLAGRRAVVVEAGDEFLAAAWEGLANYLEHPSPTATLILCLGRLNAKTPPGGAGGSSESAKDRKAAWVQMVKTIGKRGAVVDCSRLTWRDARIWLRGAAAEAGKKLTPRAVDLLVETCGPNLLALQSELGKLACYVGDAPTITERDAGEMVAEARVRSAFDLGNAVSGGDAAEAMRLCEGLLLRGEKLEGLIALLAFQVRRLWQMKRLADAGKSEAEIARELGVQGFVVRNSAPQLSRVSEESLARQTEILADADLESKTTSLRAQEEGVWLAGMVARLCEVHKPAGSLQSRARGKSGRG
jgi:DNA polymerase III delta subunit